MSDMTWDEMVAAYGVFGEPLVNCPEHLAILTARKMDSDRRAAEAAADAAAAADVPTENPTVGG